MSDFDKEQREIENQIEERAKIPMTPKVSIIDRIPEQISAEEMARKLAPINAALPKAASPFPRGLPSPSPDFRKHKAAIRRAIINAHQALGPAQDWSELDDGVLDMATNWLTDLDTRRKTST